MLKLLYLTFLLIIFSFGLRAQTAIWIEDFDDGGGGRWTLENAGGSMTNPTPPGIVGLVYGTNDPVAHDNFIINDQNTPELDNDIAVGVSITQQGQFVRGHHYACSAPSDLPNPFINGAQPGPNQSLHITAYPTCATLLYGGTAQSDDWNCISDPDNGDTPTLTEQIAFLNQNIDASGKCNLVLTADFFLGGDSDGIKAHSTILYSVDAGVTWKILQDSLSSCSHFTAGTCNNWFRRSFEIPADANNQADLRIAFRWVDDGDINDTGDYALGASFNVDNIIISACDAPVPDYLSNMDSGCKGETFIFTDMSTVADGIYTNCISILNGTCPITSWAWDFDKPGSPGGFTFVNGTNANSQNPQVQFTVNATFDVILTVTNCGGSTTVTFPAAIIIDDCPPTANFTASNTSACAVPGSEQDTVSFTDLSTTPVVPITSWSWAFTPGTVTYVGGTSSSSQNPQVVFDAIGSYQVELTVTSSEGSDTYTQTTLIEAIDCNCGGGGGGGSVLAFYEDFENSCSSGCSANGSDTGNGPWVIVDSSPAFDGCGYATSPNTFYVSCAENGQPAGGCGAGCGNDESLHVGSTTIGDLGASYDSGGWCSFGLGGWGAGTETNMIVQSPTIDLTGITSNTIDFVYIENGQGTTDDASFWYYDGSTWSMLDALAKTPLCGAQGLWTAFSMPLPASADNNPNVKIGFKWVNNDDAGGSDPSFAVDDISINGTSGGGGAANTWQGDISNDWNTAGNWLSNAVPTSADDALVPATLCGTCVMPQIAAAANVRDLCNFGVITMVGDNTLTIDRDCLNEGEITTTTVNQAADMIFANIASTYKGGGTLHDVDVSTTSGDLTLLTDMAPRSFDISTTGTVDIDVYTLKVNRNLSKSAGTFIAVNGMIQFVDACGGCLDQTNTSDVTINANQLFGDIKVNKPSQNKASLMSAFNYTLNAPNTVMIIDGILDANTSTFNGTGNVQMPGPQGEFQLAKCATVLPELTGTYTLPGGKITFDGVCNQIVKNTTTLGTNYNKVEFAGTSIKFLNGNTKISDSLIFLLPTTLGNYVDAGTDTLFLLNNNADIVYHTGGHVVGEYNRAILPSGGVYTYHVGSDNSDGETYFEPLRFTPSALAGTPSVTTRFLDATPNPTVVSPGIPFGLAPTLDTLEAVETEGYWRMHPYNSINSGTYTASVSPDINYWTFAWPWGSDAHSLLKQETEGDNWDYSNGGVRVDDSTTMSFSDFSNYALAYMKNGNQPLAASMVSFKGVCVDGYRNLAWTTATETNSHSFIIERSLNGQGFETYAEIPAFGNSNTEQHYTFTDVDRDNSAAYYRLLEMDMEGVISSLGSIHVDCEQNFESMAVDVYPNPTNGMINVNVFAAHTDIVTISILDISGQLIVSETNQVNRGGNLSTYNPGLRAGVYIVQVQNDSETLVKRFVVMD